MLTRARIPRFCEKNGKSVISPLKINTTCLWISIRILIDRANKFLRDPIANLSARFRQNFHKNQSVCRERERHMDFSRHSEICYKNHHVQLDILVERDSEGLAGESYLAGWIWGLVIGSMDVELQASGSQSWNSSKNSESLIFRWESFDLLMNFYPNIHQ